METIEVKEHLNKSFKQPQPDGLNGLIDMVSNAISKEENIKSRSLVFQRALIHLLNNESVKARYDRVLVTETMETLPIYCARKINEAIGVKITSAPMASSSIVNIT